MHCSFAVGAFCRSDIPEMHERFGKIYICWRYNKITKVVTTLFFLLQQTKTHKHQDPIVQYIKMPPAHKRYTFF